MNGGVSIKEYRDRLGSVRRDINELFEHYNSFYEVPSLKDIVMLSLEMYEIRFDKKLNRYKDRMANLIELNFLMFLKRQACEISNNNRDLLETLDLTINLIAEHKRFNEVDKSYHFITKYLFCDKLTEDISKMKNKIVQELELNDYGIKHNEISFKDYIKNIDEIYTFAFRKNQNGIVDIMDNIFRLFILENVFYHKSVRCKLQKKKIYNLDMIDFGESTVEFYSNIIPFANQVTMLFLANTTKVEAKSLVIKSYFNQCSMYKIYFSFDKYLCSYSATDYITKLDEFKAIKQNYQENKRNLINDFKIKSRRYMNAFSLIDATLDDLIRGYNVEVKNKDIIKNYVISEYIHSYKKCFEKNPNLGIKKFPYPENKSNSKGEPQFSKEEFDKMIEDRSKLISKFNYFKNSNFIMPNMYHFFQYDNRVKTLPEQALAWFFYENQEKIKEVIIHNNTSEIKNNKPFNALYDSIVEIRKMFLMNKTDSLLFDYIFKYYYRNNLISDENSVYLTEDDWGVIYIIMQEFEKTIVAFDNKKMHHFYKETEKIYLRY